MSVRDTPIGPTVGMSGKGSTLPRQPNQLETEDENILVTEANDELIWT